MSNSRPLGRANRIARSTAILASLGSLGLLLTVGWQLSLAHLFGTSGQLDAFWIGSAIPKAVADTIHLGILTLLFIAIFGQDPAGTDSQRSWRVASSVFNVVVVGTVILAVLLAIGAPLLVRVMGPGLGPEAQGLAIKLLRMLTLLLIPTALVGACAGVFNAHQKFFPFALSRVVGIATQIVVLFVLVRQVGIRAPVIALLLGALVMLSICCWTYRRSGFLYLRVIEFEGTQARAILGLFLALLAFTGLNQLNQMSDRFFASLLGPGNISILEFAWRFEIPVSQILSFSVALPAFAMMALETSEARRGDFRRIVIISVRLVALLVVPAIGFLVVLRRPLAVLWFERGAFSPESSLVVSSLIPLLGLIFLMKAFGSVMVFSLLSLRRYRELIVVLCLEVLFNTGLNLILVRYLDLLGVVLATAVAMAASSAWLWTRLIRATGGWSASSFIAQGWRTIAVSLLSIGFLQTAYEFFLAKTLSDGTTALILGVAALGFAYAITYLGLCVLFRLLEVRIGGGESTLRLSSDWDSSRTNGH